MTLQGALTAISPDGDPQWALILSFALAVLVLEFFDISLPRGDTLGVSGALNSSSILILGALGAAFSAIVGTSIAFAARRGTDRHTHPTVEMPALITALLLAAAVDLITSTVSTGTAAYYAKSFLVAATYLATELAVVQWLVSRNTSRPFTRLIRGNLTRQAPLLAAQLSTSVLTVIIFRYMGVWGLALVVVLLLLIRQSYAMLLDVRETYRTTVEVLVEAAEGLDSRRRGHAERTAEIAREIGARCGLSPVEIECISYAALLHDVDAIGRDGGLRDVCSPSEVLRGVGSFEDVARVLQVFETPSAIEATDTELLEAYVLALATDIDSASSPELRMLHGSTSVDRLGATVPQHAKAKAVAAALRQGYRVPAVS